MKYENGAWDVGAPTDMHMNSSLGQTLQGVSLGASGIVFGMEGRLIVGIGAFGFTAGPYVGYDATASLVRGSDLVTGLVGVTCRGSELSIAVPAGVGYSMPLVVTKAINFFFKVLNDTLGTNIGETKPFGGIQLNTPRPIWSNKSDNPKGCAGYK